MENSIKSELFPDATMDIILQEGFNLSDAYTPEYLYREYKEYIQKALGKKTIKTIAEPNPVTPWTIPARTAGRSTNMKLVMTILLSSHLRYETCDKFL